MKGNTLIGGLLLVTVVLSAVPQRSLDGENNPLVPIDICSEKDQILLNFIKNREQTRDIIENIEGQQVNCNQNPNNDFTVSFRYEKSLFKAKLTAFKNEVETPENMGTVCYELSTSYMNDIMVYYECFEAGDSDQDEQSSKGTSLIDDQKSSKNKVQDNEIGTNELTQNKIGELETNDGTIIKKEDRSLRQLFPNTYPVKSVKVLSGNKSKGNERRLAQLHPHELPKLLDSINNKLSRYVYGDLRLKARNQVRIEWVNSKVANIIKDYIKEDIYTVATQKIEFEGSIVRFDNWFIANSLLWNFAFKLIVKEEGTINGVFSTPNDVYEINVSVFDERLMHLPPIKLDGPSEDTEQAAHFKEVYGSAIEVFLSRVVGGKDGRRLSLEQLSVSKADEHYRLSNLPFVLGRTTVSEELQKEAPFSDASFLQHSVHTSQDNNQIANSWQKDRQLVIKSQDQISKLQIVNLPVFVLILNKFMLKEVQSNQLYGDESAAVVRGSTPVDYRLFLQRKSPLEQVGDGFQSKADTLSAEAVTTDCFFASNPNIKIDEIDINFGSFFGVISVSDLSLDKKLLLCSALGDNVDCATELSLSAAKQTAENTVFSTGEKTQKYNNGISFAYLFDHLYRVVFVRIWEYEEGFFSGFHVKVVTQFYTSEYLIASSHYEDISVAVRMLLQSNIDHLQGAVLDSMRAATIRFNLESLEQIIEFVVSEINEGLSASSANLPAEFTKKLNLCLQKEGGSAIAFHQIDVEGQAIGECSEEQAKGAKVIEIVKPTAKAGVYHIKTYSLSELNKINRPVSTVYEIREKYDYDFTSTLVDYLVRTLGSYVLSSEGAKWDVEEKSGFDPKTRHDRLKRIQSKDKSPKVEQLPGQTNNELAHDKSAEILNEQIEQHEEANKDEVKIDDKVELEKDQKEVIIDEPIVLNENPNLDQSLTIANGESNEVANKDIPVDKSDVKLETNDQGLIVQNDNLDTSKLGQNELIEVDKNTNQNDNLDTSKLGQNELIEVDKNTNQNDNLDTSKLGQNELIEVDKNTNQNDNLDTSKLGQNELIEVDKNTNNPNEEETLQKIEDQKDEAKVNQDELINTQIEEKEPEKIVNVDPMDKEEVQIDQENIDNSLEKKPEDLIQKDKVNEAEIQPLENENKELTQKGVDEQNVIVDGQNEKESVINKPNDDALQIGENVEEIGINKPKDDALQIGENVEEIGINKPNDDSLKISENLNEVEKESEKKAQDLNVVDGNNLVNEGTTNQPNNDRVVDNEQNIEKGQKQPDELEGNAKGQNEESINIVDTNRIGNKEQINEQNNLGNTPVELDGEGKPINQIEEQDLTKVDKQGQDLENEGEENRPIQLEENSNQEVDGTLKEEAKKVLDGVKENVDVGDPQKLEQEEVIKDELKNQDQRENPEIIEQKGVNSNIENESISKDGVQEEEKLNNVNEDGGQEIDEKLNDQNEKEPITLDKPIDQNEKEPITLDKPIDQIEKEPITLDKPIDQNEKEPITLDKPIDENDLNLQENKENVDTTINENENQLSNGQEVLEKPIDKNENILEKEPGTLDKPKDENDLNLQENKETIEKPLDQNENEIDKEQGQDVIDGTKDQNNINLENKPEILEKPINNDEQGEILEDPEKQTIQNENNLKLDELDENGQPKVQPNGKTGEEKEEVIDSNSNERNRMRANRALLVKSRPVLKAEQLDALSYWKENRGLFEETDGFLGDLELSDELSDRLGLRRHKIYV